MGCYREAGLHIRTFHGLDATDGKGPDEKPFIDKISFQSIEGVLGISLASVPICSLCLALAGFQSCRFFQSASAQFVLSTLHEKFSRYLFIRVTSLVLLRPIHSRQVYPFQKRLFINGFLTPSSAQQCNPDNEEESRDNEEETRSSNIIWWRVKQLNNQLFFPVDEQVIVNLQILKATLVRSRG